MRTRREFLAGAALSLSAQTTRRPNVLLVMTDQEAASLPGPSRLPNRRRIQDHGTTFTSAFCNTPQCSPARSSLQTGLEPHHSKVVSNIDAGSVGRPLSPALATVGKVFQNAGYSTGYFGKWHLGSEQRLDQFGYKFRVSGDDETLGTKAAAWIKEQRGPWLAWVSMINPHNIYFPPSVLEQVDRAMATEVPTKGAAAIMDFMGKDDYKEIAIRPGVRPPASGTDNLAAKPRAQQQYAQRSRPSREFHKDAWLRYRSYYLDLTEKADAAMGPVLDAAGDLDSTIVVYTTDHGDALGEHGLAYKGPFMYEELLHIPMVIAGPKNLAGRGERDDFVNQTDIAPTLAGMAGIVWPSKVDGFDLSKRPARRDAIFSEYYGQQRAVSPIRTIRTRRWKLNWYDDGDKELYDLRTDPHELKNLAGGAGAKQEQAELEARLEAWRPAMKELEKTSTEYSVRR